jgi:hypothetical protein
MRLYRRHSRRLCSVVDQARRIHWIQGIDVSAAEDYWDCVNGIGCQKPAGKLTLRPQYTHRVLAMEYQRCRQVNEHAGSTSVVSDIAIRRDI